MDVAQQVDPGEPDALDDLSAKLVEVSRAAAPQPTTRAEGLVLPGGEVGGEQPNILSGPARHRLVRHSQRLAIGLYGAGGLIAIVLVFVDLAGEPSEVWPAIVFAFVAAGTATYLISYLTVMGFGKVTLKLGGGGSSDRDSGKGDGGADSSGEDGGGQKNTRAA